MTSKFMIGDQVTSKKTGLPAIGTIGGIMSAETYLCSTGRHDIDKWTELYRYWKDKAVYYVLFDIPQCNISFKEYCDFYHVEETDDIRKIYAHDCRKCSMASYPEDDLELLEE